MARWYAALRCGFLGRVAGVRAGRLTPPSDRLRVLTVKLPGRSLISRLAGPGAARSLEVARSQRGWQWRTGRESLRCHTRLFQCNLPAELDLFYWQARSCACNSVVEIAISSGFSEWTAVLPGALFSEPPFSAKCAAGRPIMTWQEFPRRELLTNQSTLPPSRYVKPGTH